MRIRIKTLTKKILFNPALEGADKLVILSGYATPNMASWLIKNLKLKKKHSIAIELYIGMTPYDGLSLGVHNGFLSIINEKLPKSVRSFTCSYLFEHPVNSSVYLWLKGGKPYAAFTGSAYFTQRAFCSECEELMQDYDPNAAQEYISRCIGHSIYCNHAEVEEYITMRAAHPFLDDENNFTAGIDYDDSLETMTLSLLARNGTVAKTSGLNWGHRAKRNRNEAYIPLPSRKAKSGFFPCNKNHFTVITDDQKFLIMRVEQENDKAITTPLSNALLGEYFRNRLDLPNGTFITKEHLEKHGRTDVTFVKLDEEQYYMDFSVPLGE